MTTHTRTYTLVTLANKHMVCEVCERWVFELRQPTGDNHPCGHTGVRSLCPTWGPVDGCTCPEGCP